MSMAWFLAPMFDWTRFPFFVPLRYVSQRACTIKLKQDLPFVYVPPGTVTSDKADRLYAGMITDGIYRRDSPVYHVNDAWGKSCPLTEFSNDHCRTGVSLGGLQDEGVSSYCGHRN